MENTFYLVLPEAPPPLLHLPPPPHHSPPFKRFHLLASFLRCPLFSVPTEAAFTELNSEISPDAGDNGRGVILEALMCYYISIFFLIGGASTVKQSRTLRRRNTSTQVNRNRNKQTVCAHVTAALFFIYISRTLLRRYTHLLFLTRLLTLP